MQDPFNASRTSKTFWLGRFHVTGMHASFRATCAFLPETSKHLGVVCVRCCANCHDAKHHRKTLMCKCQNVFACVPVRCQGRTCDAGRPQTLLCKTFLTPLCGHLHTCPSHDSLLSQLRTTCFRNHHTASGKEFAAWPSHFHDMLYIALKHLPAARFHICTEELCTL